jgi:hypothetical protein
VNGSSKISLLACGIAAFFAVNANASPYVEGGVSAGTLTNGQNYFGQSNASSTHLGYLGSLSFYVPVTSERRFFHFDLGLQNRILSASSNRSTWAQANSRLASKSEDFMSAQDMHP